MVVRVCLSLLLGARIPPVTDKGFCCLYVCMYVHIGYFDVYIHKSLFIVYVHMYGRGQEDSKENARACAHWSARLT